MIGFKKVVIFILAMWLIVVVIVCEASAGAAYVVVHCNKSQTIDQQLGALTDAQNRWEATHPQFQLVSAIPIGQDIYLGSGLSDYSARMLTFGLLINYTVKPVPVTELKPAYKFVVEPLSLSSR